MPLVSIVVLSWNTITETKECLNSIFSLSYSNIEVIVVDNGSTDGSKEYLSDLGDKIKFIDLPKNTGFTGGQLAAYEVANGEYLALINSDAVVAKNWVDVLIKEFRSDDLIAAAGGKSFRYSENQPAYNTSNDFYSYQVIDPRLGYAETLQNGERRVEVNSISGAGVIIKRSVIEKYGYFDNQFFAYYEETDLFARFKRAGLKIVYNPNAHIWHKIAASSKPMSYFYLRQMHRNRFRYAFKNFDNRYIPRLFLDYWARWVRSGYLLARRRADIDHKARFFAGLWTIIKIPNLIYERLKTQRLGDTYSQLLFSDEAEVITVIIPCYNYADHVAEAIESALNQSLKPAQVIVINDGSTDKSIEVIRKYKKNVRIIDKKNQGIIATKNLGISLLNTSKVVFLDADDKLSEDYLKLTLKCARTKSADVVYTDMKLFGAKNEDFKAVRFSFYRLLEGNFIHNSALIDVTKLKQVGGYKQDMSGGYEDWELYISLYEKQARFKYLKDRPLLYYRQHDRQQGRNTEAIRKDKKLRKQIAELHPEHAPILLGKSLYSGRAVLKRTYRGLSRLRREPRHVKWLLIQNFRRANDKRKRFIEKNIFARSLIARRTRGLWWLIKERNTKEILNKIKIIFSDDL